MIMNDKDNFQILRDERTKLVNENADLQTEIARLREAAQHFMNCDFCGENFICFEGQVYANRAEINFVREKAV